MNFWKKGFHITWKCLETSNSIVHAQNNSKIFAITVRCLNIFELPWKVKTANHKNFPIQAFQSRHHGFSILENSKNGLVILEKGTAS